MRKTVPARISPKLNLNSKSPLLTSAAAIAKKLEEIKASQSRQSSLGHLALFQNKKLQ